MTALSAALIVAAIDGCATREPIAPERLPLASSDHSNATGTTQERLVPERVTFDSLDRDSATGAPVRITALLFRPQGPSAMRYPAVVALHGCGGMYSSLASRRENLSLRHQAMAKLLANEGYVVLFPDSFRSRGFEEICMIANQRRTISQTNRRLDAQGALAYLQARADVAQDRVAVLGWSHGGSAVLAILNARQSAVAAWKNRAASSSYFRAAVAFYPGCIDSLRERVGYAFAAPLTLLSAPPTIGPHRSRASISRQSSPPSASQ